MEENNERFMFKDSAYALPPWRIDEIEVLAMETLKTGGYFDYGFDYRKMITDTGIRIKKFSSFKPENLAEFSRASLSLWNDGVCLVIPRTEECGPKKMIAYNDTLSDAQVMYILLHEFAHILLKHTQQSINGESEAACFAVAMKILIEIRSAFLSEMEKVLFGRTLRDFPSKMRHLKKASAYKKEVI